MLNIDVGLRSAGRPISALRSSWNSRCASRISGPNPHRCLASMIQLPDHMTVPGHPQVMSLNMFRYVEGPSVVATSRARTGAGL